MRNYIPQSPLRLSLAASFVLFILFGIVGREGVASRREGVASRREGVASRREGDASRREGVASIRPPGSARQQAIPCVFDNFVWFKDQEIIDEIRKDVPSFDGTAPEAGDSIGKILGVLERMLKKKGLPRNVEYIFFSGSGYQYRPEHVFAARDAKIPICKLVFQNAPPQIDKELQQAAQGLVNKDYSKVITKSFVEGAAVQVFRKYGHLRAAARILSAELDQSCKASVVVKVAAEPGPGYIWDKAVWSGNRAFSSQSLDAALELKPGDLADGLKIDAGLQAAVIVYRKLGYAELQIVPKPVFDDVNRRFTLNVAITEGSQFKMGDFIVKGIPENSVQILKGRWALKTGAVYDASYIDDFIKKLVDDKLIPPDLARLLKPEFKLDRQRLAVDVIIDFKV